MHTSAYSRLTVLPSTFSGPLGASPQPPGPNARFSVRLYLISGKKMMPSGLISTSTGSTGASKTSAMRASNGWDPRPLKLLLQSVALVSGSEDSGVAAEEGAADGLAADDDEPP